MKKYNYIYKLTNQITGNTYYGINSTDFLDDGCVNISDPLLTCLFDKYGIRSFTKEIIKMFDTRAELVEYYSENITHTKYDDEIYCTEFFVNTNQLLVKDKDGNLFLVDENDERLKNKVLKQVKTYKRRKQTEDTCNKRSETMKRNGNHKGEKNPQYGKCWIYKPETFESIRIDKSEIERYLSNGWVKGRKINK